MATWMEKERNPVAAGILNKYKHTHVCICVHTSTRVVQHVRARTFILVSGVYDAMHTCFIASFTYTYTSTSTTTYYSTCHCTY